MIPPFAFALVAVVVVVVVVGGVHENGAPFDPKGSLIEMWHTFPSLSSQFFFFFLHSSFHVMFSRHFLSRAGNKVVIYERWGNIGLDAHVAYWTSKSGVTKRVVGIRIL
jgi:hypothetical protein